MNTLYRHLEHSDSIRLLKFPTGSDHTVEALQHLSLITIRLSDPSRPHYQAVSYAWGQDTDQKTICIDGVDLRIRSNLWDFLHQAVLSRDMEISYLWIDGLCICQTDQDEKAAQVQQMGHTFSSADRVIAWLGAGDRQVVDRDHLRDNYLSRACRAPYWTRTWVAQELLLAHDLLFCYGQYTFTERQFAKVYATHGRTLWSVQHAEVATYLCSMLLELRSFFRGSGRLADDSYARSLEGEAASRPSNDLLAVVKTFRGSVCSVVLDKVYALLSIVDWEGRQPLRVDYMIDEVLLYYRALSSARHVDFGYAEHLRRGLQIDQRLLLERSVQLFQDDAVAKLEIETAFSIAAYTGPNYDGEDGMIPPRFPRAFGKMPFSLHLHQGVVRQKDLLAQFRGTDVSLVFARVGTTGKYTVKGMIFTVWSSLLNHSIVHCPNRCLNDFSDIELELEDTPAISDVTHFVPIKAKSWLSLFRHHCQKGEASMVFNRKNNKST